MDGQIVCKFFQFGHCKFADKCRKRHIREICQEECRDENCQLRHPKHCRFFVKYKRCKFGDFCSYKHRESSPEFEYSEIQKELISLKSKIECFEKLIEEKDSEIKVIKEKAQNMETLVIQLKDKLDKPENENSAMSVDDIIDKDKKDSKHFECDQCSYKCKTNVGLTLHKRKKHKKIPQLDGCGDYVDQLDECNISVETQTDYVCEKCAFSAENSDMLSNHRSLVHKDYECWDCDFSTDQRYIMKKHIQDICS